MIATISGKKYLYVSLPTLATAILCTYNFYSALGCLDVSWDGFIYLTMAKYRMGSPFLDPVRSPIIAYILAPSIFGLRIEMLLILTFSTILTYLIGEEISGDTKKASLAAFLVGTYWWLVHYTVYALTELLSLFFLLLATYLVVFKPKKPRRSLNRIAGIFAGLAFIVRYEVMLAIFPLILLVWRLKGNKQTKDFLVSLVLVAGVFEFLSCYFFFQKMVYSPWEFLYVWTMTRPGYLGHLMRPPVPHYYYMSILFKTNPILMVLFSASIIWQLYKRRINTIATGFTFIVLLPFSLFPSKEFRWIISSMPFLAILSAEVLDLIEELFSVIRSRAVKLPLSVKDIAVLAITISVLVYNTYNLITIPYPEFLPDKVNCTGKGSLCSNYPSIVMYFTGHYCENIFWKEGFPDHKLETAIEVITKYECFILFKPKPMRNVVLGAPYYFISSSGAFDPQLTRKVEAWCNRTMITHSMTDVGSFIIIMYLRP